MARSLNGSDDHILVKWPSLPVGDIAVVPSIGTFELNIVTLK